MCLKPYLVNSGFLGVPPIKASSSFPLAGVAGIFSFEDLFSPCIEFDSTQLIKRFAIYHMPVPTLCFALERCSILQFP
ncbi:Piso0_003669 [Millerozyma farinosa CBS 7064]|uniref:Piso0_003669 protein n=1 Tax=Pichia sorbitophila (strain ATCC MYA-4447 / BCRC 22081 / CBS 7064 / NBRC 10061 / NRRL Y-12695) TaxID=559304 RepID=G8YGJ8_PICSO|nr:Piso0_003669 [Millerozyma farinosa CBS 7064]CCE81315.1 Piso0_003669 [Millerozyma farinosa CBS 7064]